MALNHRVGSETSQRASPSRAWRAILAGVALLAGLAASPGVSRAASNHVALRYFPDVTTELGGLTFGDEDVVEELRPSGAITQIGIGSIPPAAALTAYHVRAGGLQVVSFDSTVQLPGGLVAAPGDVVQTNFDGTASYSPVFDASAHGVPDGVRVDAIDFTSNVGGDLLLSFDATVTLPAPSGTITAADEDLVRLTGSTFTVLFDGSAAGVPVELDLDGVDFVPANGHFLVSFDVAGTLGGISFQDEDVLEYAPSGSSWEMAYDGSALHSEWPGANLGGAAVLTDLDLDATADEYETDTGVYVSQYETGTDPADADTDDDGLLDGAETNTGTYVSAQDTGTHPLDADSDDDGFSDGYEVGQGSDPNDPQSTPVQNVPTMGPLGFAVLALGMLAIGRHGLRRRMRGG